MKKFECLLGLLRNQRHQLIVVLLGISYWFVNFLLGRVVVNINRIPLLPKLNKFDKKDLEYILSTKQYLTNRRNMSLAFSSKMKNYEPKPKMEYCFTQVDFFQGTLYRLKNYYISGYYAFANQGFMIHNTTFNSPRKHFFRPEPGEIVGIYKTVLVVGHHACYIYGHFILDCLSPLMIIPDEIKNKSFLLLPKMEFDISELIRFAGFENRIVQLGKRQWIFAEESYLLTEPRPHGEYQSVCLYNLSIALKKHFKIDKTIPDRIGLHQRTGEYRVITNIPELLQKSSEIWPNEKFVRIEDKFASIAECAKSYSQLKILLAVAGSNLLNCMFMAEKTVLIEVMCNIWNFHVTSAIIVFDLYLIVISQEMMSHSYPSQVPLNFTDVKPALEAAFHVLKNNCFPKIQGTEIF